MSQYITKASQFGVNNLLYLPLKKYIQVINTNINNFKHPGRFDNYVYVYGNNFGMYYTAGTNLAQAKYDSSNDTYDGKTIDELIKESVNNTKTPVDLVDACAMIHDVQLTQDKCLTGVINANVKVIDNISKSTKPHWLIDGITKIVAYPLSVVVSLAYWGFENLLGYSNVKFSSETNNMVSEWQNLIDKYN